MNNELQLYDIYEQWHIPFWQTQWFFWTILACVFTIVLVLIFLLFKKYYYKRSLSPAHQALHELAQLKKKNITTRQDAHEAYFELTSILKKFFQANYMMPFASMSDNEMVVALKKTTVSIEHVEQVNTIVNKSLMVKYARENALQEDVLQAVTTSIEIVKQINSTIK